MVPSVLALLVLACASTAQLPPSDWQRTIIFIHKETSPSQYVFLRGGLDHSRRPDCVHNATVDPCSIPIWHIWTTRYGKYNAWRQGDNFLDWYGPEWGQGMVESINFPPQGTPMMWTTDASGWCDPNDMACYYQGRLTMNDPDYFNAERAGFGYTPRNKWGEHYWMLDVLMDCSRTWEGWFNVKAYLTPEREWEPDIWQRDSCTSCRYMPPPSSRNHMARCGVTNVFQWGKPFPCEIFPNHPDPALPDNY
ncbi:uncharacterized protein LOC106153287 isoform X2 [Lingula anatina]|uniref:Uncharacterized protein LOC106153287 isoform X2 n=1 Tax=Lingula anatina TaxID=7574 RepID=A0A1S3H9E2_LINAN|nr:uncharacterized protein LOC106153287 isoform X2 [Lingula anatina]|eukprot:XP_013382622.1 uncharacterized protein LOC106153287 isoform X2 [Lingula anatina]